MAANSTPNMRKTKQREAVLGQLEAHDGFQSAQQIHAALVHSGESVGLATVYRTLQALAAAKAVSVMRTDDGEALYRHCDTERHHHHIVCRRCGATQEISGLGLENFLTTVGGDSGFTELEHVIEIWGLCRACQPDG
jgi:Fur family ferric uptake transcriptional regulator